MDFCGRDALRHGSPRTLSETIILPAQPFFPVVPPRPTSKTGQCAFCAGFLGREVMGKMHFVDITSQRISTCRRGIFEMTGRDGTEILPGVPDSAIQCRSVFVVTLWLLSRDCENRSDSPIVGSESLAKRPIRTRQHLNDAMYESMAWGQ